MSACQMSHKLPPRPCPPCQSESLTKLRAGGPKRDVENTPKMARRSNLGLAGCRPALAYLNKIIVNTISTEGDATAFI